MHHAIPCNTYEMWWGQHPGQRALSTSFAAELPEQSGASYVMAVDPNVYSQSPCYVCHRLVLILCTFTLTCFLIRLVEWRREYQGHASLMFTSLRMRCRQEGPVEPVHNVEDRTIPGPACHIPIRIYRPQPDGKQPLSALVYNHGELLPHGNLWRVPRDMPGAIT